MKIGECICVKSLYTTTGNQTSPGKLQGAYK